MKNKVLASALGVSMEDIENERIESEDLLERLVEEQNDLTPERYVDERLEVEGDISILEERAAELDGEERPSHESIDSAVAIAKAAIGRYGLDIPATGLESFEDPKARANMVVAQLRETAASLESAMDVTMEAYSITDLWDHVSLLNREIPALKDNLSILKNYTGSSAKLVLTPMLGRSLVYQFRVNGEIPDNIPKAASDTAAIVDDLIRLGQAQVDASKRAADIALNCNWKDPASVEKALSSIKGVKTMTLEIYKRFDETFTMGNRRLNVKKFDIKGASEIGDWATGASLNVSWPKSTAYDLIFDPSIVQVVQGSRRRPIKVDDMVNSLDKILSAAQKTSQVRSNSPKKWQEHKQLKVRMKKDVSGSGEAKAVRRAIVEADRLGWQCINGALTILYFIIREINVAAERMAKAARKQSV